MGDRFVRYRLGLYVSLLTLAVYLPALRNDFVTWDDHWYVVNNANIRSLNLLFFKWAFWDSQTILWHPLAWVSHAVDYALWGLHPAGHHLTSILLHAFNTLFVYVLAVKLLESGAARINTSEGSKPATAAMTAFLFGVHPLHVESVAWISERKDVLSAFFFLLALVSYLRYRRAASDCHRTGIAGFPVRPYLLCLGCAALALMSKPMAVTLPLVMLIIDWHPLGRFKDRKSSAALFLEKLPFFALSLVAGWFTLMPGRNFATLATLLDSSPLTTILVGCRSLIFYLIKMLWPMDLVPLYVYTRDAAISSPRYFIPLALVVAITGAGLYLAKRRKDVPALWASYVVMLLPVMGIYRGGLHAVADRYTYLPSIGPFLVMGGVAAAVWEKTDSLQRGGPSCKRLVAALAVVLFAALPYLTLQQIMIWKNSQVLWTYVVRKSGEAALDNATARNNLGLALDARGEHDKAIVEYEHALRLDPYAYKALNNMGVTLGKKGRFAESVACFTEAIRLKPDFAEAHGNLGVALEGLGRTREAVHRYREALRLNPQDQNIRHNLDKALALRPD